jgi:aryl-alcohol dehydrogenase-like predicted oxidoreductase
MRKGACAAISRPTSSDIPASYSASRRGILIMSLLLVLSGASRTRQSGQADASACRCRPEGRRQINAERNDGIIIGVSSLEHLRHNLTAVTEGPLPTEVLAAIDDAALRAQPKWPPYFSGV